MERKHKPWPAPLPSTKRVSSVQCRRPVPAAAAVMAATVMLTEQAAVAGADAEAITKNTVKRDAAAGGVADMAAVVAATTTNRRMERAGMSAGAADVAGMGKRTSPQAVKAASPERLGMYCALR